MGASPEPSGLADPWTGPRDRRRVPTPSLRQGGWVQVWTIPTSTPNQNSVLKANNKEVSQSTNVHTPIVIGSSNSKTSRTISNVGKNRKSKPLPLSSKRNFSSSLSTEFVLNIRNFDRSETSTQVKLYRFERRTHWSKRECQKTVNSLEYPLAGRFCSERGSPSWVETFEVDQRTRHEYHGGEQYKSFYQSALNSFL